MFVEALLIMFLLGPGGVPETFIVDRFSGVTACKNYVGDLEQGGVDTQSLQCVITKTPRVPI